MHVPETIRKYIDNQEYSEDNVGMSDSRVLIFQDKVLKIQKRTSETDNENNMAKWLENSIPVPKILAYCVESETAYTLMSKITGKMLCDETYLNNPKTLIHIAAEGMKLLWNTDISDCPYKVSRLEERLKEARYNVENGLVDEDNVEPETFGPGGFSNPMELLCWLEHNRPEEDIVLTHGDFCLPNIFANEDRLSGFIDIGKMGPADRWQDVAIALRSLKHNFDGIFATGVQRFDFEPKMLLDELGIEMDEEKNRYYMLLDEFF